MFDRLARSGQLFGVIQLLKRRAVLNAIPSNDYALFRKQIRAGIPNHPHSLLRKREATVNGIVLLPEAPGFPGNFVGRIIRGAEDGLAKIG
jgi:hypothetical protein